MTKKEFNKYVDSFGKKPGFFTEDEIYEIGLEHKNLLKGDRNWSKLSKKLGVKKDGKLLTGEQFRILIRGIQKQRGELPRNMRVLSGKNIEDLTFDEVVDSLELQKQELFKQQTKTRDTYNAYKRAMREDARFELLEDNLKEAMKNLPKLSKVTYKQKTPKSDTEAVFLLSDIHIGVACNNNVNEYNLEVAKRRLAKCTNDVIEQCKRNKVKKLNIINLGDNIQGLIHTSARVEQEEDVASQVMIAAELIANVVNDLQEAAPVVTYRSCSDNHSRMIPSKEDHIAQENFGKLIDTIVGLRLQGTKVQMVKDNLDFGLGAFELENGKYCCFSHGHEDRINTVVQDMSEITGRLVDYVFMGHLHNVKLKTFNRSKVFINGSIMGTDQYAFGKRLSSPAEQMLLIWEDKNLITCVIGLQEA